MNELSLPTIVDGEDKASPLKNRIRKNYRHLRKWAKRTQTDCFRIYDREIPHYPLAIDFYAGRFCVQYFPKSSEFIEPPSEIITAVENALTSIFSLPINTQPTQSYLKEPWIYWRLRIKREKLQQYEKAGEAKEFFTVYEYGVKFRINLRDYLDTGLFLDHRETRHMVAAIANGKHVLNLFAYTCSFSVHAAAAGAASTKSVDMSNAYTSWGKENFILNNLSCVNTESESSLHKRALKYPNGNEIVRADCLKFLATEVATGAKYDIIIIDPPTISRSKKMDQMFDIQVDYIYLITKALQLLSPKGVIFFSTNSLKFKFDITNFPVATIIEISNKTIPMDFHKANIHRCWRITS